MNDSNAGGAPGAAPTPGPATAPAGAPKPPAAPASSGPDPAAALAGAVSGLVSRLSMGELLTFGGAAIVLLAIVVFGLLANSNWASLVELYLASAAVGVVLGQRFSLWDFGGSYRGLVIALGLLLGVAFVYDFLYFIRQGGFGNLSGTYVFASLVYWIGEAVAGVGAYFMWRQKA
jgi:hypothetical protein